MMINKINDKQEVCTLLKQMHADREPVSQSRRIEWKYGELGNARNKNEQDVR